jgi:membrane protease YdiL (CAAX protease family)
VHRLTHLLLGVATRAAAGFFEEIGWTGFAIPTLRKRLTPTQTGVVLGVIWGAWHTLVSWWGSAGAAGVPMAVYLPIVLFAMLMHAALTGSVRVQELTPRTATPL